MAILILPSLASAQTIVGIKGGVNFNTIDYSIEGVDEEFLPDFTRRPGIVAGLFVGRDFDSKLGIQIEALYSQKGVEADDIDIEGNPVNAKFMVDYLEIPVLVSARIGSSGDATFRVYGGPTMAFNLRETAEFDGVESDEDAGIKSFDAGIAVGASVTVRRFVLDGRYTHGLVNVEDEDPDFVTARNRTISFTIGWRFN